MVHEFGVLLELLTAWTVYTLKVGVDFDLVVWSEINVFLPDNISFIEKDDFDLCGSRISDSKSCITEEDNLCFFFCGSVVIKFFCTWSFVCFLHLSWSFRISATHASSFEFIMKSFSLFWFKDGTRFAALIRSSIDPAEPLLVVEIEAGMFWKFEGAKFSCWDTISLGVEMIVLITFSLYLLKSSLIFDLFNLSDFAMRKEFVNVTRVLCSVGVLLFDGSWFTFLAITFITELP